MRSCGVESFVAQFFCSFDKSNCKLITYRENDQKEQRFDRHVKIKNISQRPKRWLRKFADHEKSPFC